MFLQKFRTFLLGTSSHRALLTGMYGYDPRKTIFYRTFKRKPEATPNAT